jgi:hypothetical protein
MTVGTISRFLNIFLDGSSRSNYYGTNELFLFSLKMVLTCIPTALLEDWGANSKLGSRHRHLCWSGCVYDASLDYL